MLADGVKENDRQHDQVRRGQEAKQSQTDHNQRVGQHGQAQITHESQDRDEKDRQHPGHFAREFDQAALQSRNLVGILEIIRKQTVGKAGPNRSGSEDRIEDVNGTLVFRRSQFRDGLWRSHKSNHLKCKLM